MALLLLFVLFVCNFLIPTTGQIICLQNATLIQLVEKSFTSIDDACNGVYCLNQYYVQHSDRRAEFLSVYVEMVFSIRDDIEEGILFVDKQWMETYLTLFAELFRVATYNWEIGNLELVHPAWQIHFEHAQKGDLLIVQNLWLGVNAHILSDLCYALQMMNISSDQISQHNDSTNVNIPIMQVYTQMLPPLLDLYAPVLNVTSFAHEILVFVEDIIAVQRERAWNLALDLLYYGGPVLDEYIQITAQTAAILYVNLPEWASPWYEEAKKLEGPNQVDTFCKINPFKCPY